MIDFKRWRRWLYRRVVKLQGSAHAIARGMAVGVVIGCVIPPGVQIIVGFPVALLFGANIIAMAVGTLISNPVTYLPLYYFTCQVGAAFLRFLGANAQLGEGLKELLREVIHLNPAGVLRGLRPILASWTAGGLIIGLACSVPAYYITYFFVVEVHRLREFSRQRRAARRRALMADEPMPAAPQEPDEEAPDEQPPPPPQ